MTNIKTDYYEGWYEGEYGLTPFEVEAATVSEAINVFKENYRDARDVDVEAECFTDDGSVLDVSDVFTKAVASSAFARTVA